MLETNENINPANPANELRQLIARLQQMTVEAVIREFNNVQSDATELKNKTDQKEGALRSNKGNLPESIKKENNNQRKIDSIVNKVKQIVISIREPSLNHQNNILANLNDSSKRVIISLTELSSMQEIGKINEKNSFYINEIINRGLKGRLSSVEDIIDAFRSIENLQYLDSLLYIEISHLFQKSVEGRATEDQIDRLKTEDQKEDEHKGIDGSDRQEKFIELKKDSINLGDNIKNLIDRVITVDSLKHSDAAKKIRERAREYSPDENSRSQVEEKLFQDQVERIKGELKYILDRMAVGNAPPITKSMTNAEATEARRKAFKEGLITRQDINANLQNFINEIGAYQNDGIITAGTYEQLRNLGVELSENEELLMSFRQSLMKEGRNLYGIATGYITTWDKRQEDLLKVLDNIEEFKAHVKKSEKDGGYNGFRKNEDWQRFRDDIRKLFDTIFAGANANPKDFWERSFNELTEGTVYKQLSNSLFKLGNDLKKDLEFGGKTPRITVEVVEWIGGKEDSPYVDSPLSGSALLMRKKIFDRGVGEAINSLTNEMIDYKDLTEYGHNINALTELGLGIDKLAEMSARLRMEDVMKMIRNLPGLSDALQFYHENINMEMAQNNRIFHTDFGMQFGEDNLDSVGYKTLIQLKANKNIVDRKLIDKDIVRLVRLASSLSKGAFGGFFGTGWVNRMPHDVEWQQGDGKDESDKRPFGKLTKSWKSLKHRGIEKTLASLDLDLGLQRFNLPRLWPELRYAYAPRKDLRVFKPTREDYWINHADIYKWKEEGERAWVNGRRNELIDFDFEHVFLMDILRTESIDIALREGWRYYDYRRWLVYKTGEGSVDEKTNKNLIDFDKIIMRLQGVGPQVVKIFINDLFDTRQDFQKEISSLSLENISSDIIRRNLDDLKKFGSINFDAHGNLIGKLNGEQKNILRELYYDKYVFQHIRKTRPSHFIAMENRRWMPEDEVRGKPDGSREGITFHDQFLDYLVGVYHNKYSNAWIESNLLPMYIGALQATEKNVWDQRYKIWQDNEISGNFDPQNNPFEYNFSEISESAFDENREFLEDYCDTYNKTLIGRSSQTGMKEYRFEGEKFVENLKGFYKRMDDVINKDRWTHNMEKQAGRWVQKGKKETLTRRYAKMLSNKMGNIDSYLTWSLINLEEFHFETSGNRLTERQFAESAKDIQEGFPALSDILFHKLAEFTRTEVTDINQLEESIKRHFAEDFIKINDVISLTDQSQAWRYIQKLMMTFTCLMGKDRIYRIGLLGPLMEGVNRRWNKAQTSFTTDKIPITMRQGATALDSAGVELFYRTLGNAVGMPREREQVEEYEPPKLFNKEVKGIWAKILPKKT